MDIKQTRNNKNKFLKLSLKKNRLKIDEEMNKKNRSSDVIILDESFDRLRSEYTKSKTQKIYSPIIINDSCELSMDEELLSITLPKKNKDMKTPKIYSPIIINESCRQSKDISPCISKASTPEKELYTNTKEMYKPNVIKDCKQLSIEDSPWQLVKTNGIPSKDGNISFNGSLESTSPANQGRPSVGGWSPAQNILCATPRNEPVPSTPKDVANESFEQCSIKKIQHSQKKLLSDLYGETWKSIPALFKTIKRNYSNFDGVSKKLQFEDDENDRVKVRKDLKQIKSLYLTESETKKRADALLESEKKSKRKLYTEKIPSTPEVPKQSVKRNINSTTKKKNVNKALSVTELVEIMRKDIDILSEKVGKVTVNPTAENVNRLSFVGSLAENVPSWQCHPEAIQYRDNYKTLREQLTRRLYEEFNRKVFEDALDADMPIIWDTKLRSTAGTTTNRRIKTAKGDCIRTSSIKLCTKVLDAPERLRDTLIHEMCHAATWLIDGDLKAGHGPLWKKWATRALQVYPELGEISRCHDMAILFKYTYKCTQCGYRVQRHSKSLDVTKKCCGYCRGTFEIIVNKKNKDGVVVSTPARKGTTNEFAKFVKEHYASKKEGRTHAEVMKILGEEFSAMKKDKV